MTAFDCFSDYKPICNPHLSFVNRRTTIARSSSIITKLLPTQSAKSHTTVTETKQSLPSTSTSSIFTSTLKPTIMITTKRNNQTLLPTIFSTLGNISNH